MTDINLKEIKQVKEGGAPKILFYAADKFGKSTFANEAPNPLFIDFDSRLKEIECAKLPCKSYPELLDMIGQLLKQEHDFKTLVLDSAGSAEQLINKFVVEGYNASIQDSAKKGRVDSIGGIPYGAGYPEALANWKRLLNGLQLLNDKGMIIILLCHADYVPWEDDDGTQYKRYVPDLKGASEKAGSIMQFTRKWVDCTLYGRQERYNESVEVNGKTKKVAGSMGERQLCTNETPLWVAGNAYKLPDFIPFTEGRAWDNFYKLINKKD